MPNNKIDQSIVDEVQRLLNAGMLQKEIAEKMGKKHQYIHGIISRYGLRKQSPEITLPKLSLRDNK